MGIEFSKRAVIKVIMDAMIAENYDLQDLYDKVEAMEEPTQQQQFCAPHSCRSQIGIEELIEKIDKEMFAYPEMEPEQDDEATEDFKDGYNQASKVIIGYLNGLPTQPAFEVGEYYADDVFIYKIRRVNPNSLKVDYLNKQTGEFVANEHWSLWIPTPEPATPEQIATFKRAEHFAAHRRKLDEFKTDDICTFRGRVVLIQGLDGAGDLWFYGNQFGEEYLSKEELKHLTLIQTSEELREVRDNESL